MIKKLNKNKDIKIYNMILPPFMLFAFVPYMWLISLVGNFIIDSIVLILATLIICRNFKETFATYKKLIIKVWLYGFLADFCGILYLLTLSLTGSFYVDYEQFKPNSLGYQIWEGIHLAMNQSHFDSIWGVIFIFSGILFAAICIFLFDYFFVLRHSKFTKKQAIITALAFAIITAPYTFLLPKSLFY